MFVTSCAVVSLAFYMGFNNNKKDGGAAGGKGAFQEVNCNFGFEQDRDLFLV